MKDSHNFWYTISGDRKCAGSVVRQTRHATYFDQRISSTSNQSGQIGAIHAIGTNSLCPLFERKETVDCAPIRWNGKWMGDRQIDTLCRQMRSIRIQPTEIVHHLRSGIRSHCGSARFTFVASSGVFSSHRSTSRMPAHCRRRLHILFGRHWLDIGCETIRYT